MIEINDNTYQINKLSLFDQIHIARKIAPVMSGLGQTITLIQKQIEEMREEEAGGEDIFSRIIWDSSGPITEALSKMPEDDTNFVIKKCLAVVTRLDKSSGRYSKILASNGTPMFDDIDMMTTIRLVWEVVQDNLGNFSLSRPDRVMGGVG